MKLKLGQKIKMLRQQVGITQTMLADVLGVSNQAVSYWESDGGYPDTEFLPSIANYFGISMDELFGYCGTRDTKIREIVDKADEYLNAQGDMTECIALLRDAADEFPSNSNILIRLGYALNIQGWKLHGCRSYIEAESNYVQFDKKKNSEGAEWIEAIHIFERLLNTPSLLAELPLADREVMLSILLNLYCILGMADCGIKLANKQQSVRCSREVLLGSVAIGEENYHYIEEEIAILMELLLHSMHSAINSNRTFYNNLARQNLTEFEESCRHWSEYFSCVK